MIMGSVSISVNKIPGKYLPLVFGKNIFSKINSSINMTATIRRDVIVKNRTPCFW
jgi:hypothetical protein